MPEVGIEPTCLTAIDLKSIAATNYATRAINQIIAKKLLNYNHFKHLGRLLDF